MEQSVAMALVVALFVSIPAVGHAQSSGGMKGMDMKDMDMKGMKSGKKAQGTVHKAVGVVKKVDSGKSAVTLDHEPIKSMNWPAMTMTFTVHDKTILDKLQSGKKVEFEFVQQGKDYVVTSVR